MCNATVTGERISLIAPAIKQKLQATQEEMISKKTLYNTGNILS